MCGIPSTSQDGHYDPVRYECTGAETFFSCVSILISQPAGLCSCEQMKGAARSGRHRDASVLAEDVSARIRFVIVDPRVRGQQDRSPPGRWRDVVLTTPIS